MNCTPNSVAMFVRNTYGLACVSALIGTPLTVTDLLTDDADGMGPAWAFRGKPLKYPNCGDGLIGMLDADLQQLHPPSAKSSTESWRDIINEVAHPKPKRSFRGERQEDLPGRPDVGHQGAELPGVLR